MGRCWQHTSAAFEQTAPRTVLRSRLQEFCALNILKSRTATKVIDRETPPTGVFRAEHFEQQDSEEGH